MSYRLCFFFNDTATTKSYTNRHTLSLHDALPISRTVMIRDDIKAALVQSMKARNEARTSAIRLIQAAIKNKDIELRTGGGPADDDALIIDVLQKMAKQRRE